METTKRLEEKSEGYCWRITTDICSDLIIFFMDVSVCPSGEQLVELTGRIRGKGGVGESVSRNMVALWFKNAREDLGVAGEKGEQGPAPPMKLLLLLKEGAGGEGKGGGKSRKEGKKEKEKGGKLRKNLGSRASAFGSMEERQDGEFNFSNVNPASLSILEKKYGLTIGGETTAEREKERERGKEGQRKGKEEREEGEVLGKGEKQKKGKGRKMKSKRKRGAHDFLPPLLPTERMFEISEMGEGVGGEGGGEGGLECGYCRNLLKTQCLYPNKAIVANLPTFQMGDFKDSLKFIGEGGYSDIYAVGEGKVLKVMKESVRTRATMGDFEKEVSIMAKNPHPFLVSFVAWCPPSFAILMEMMELGDLRSFLVERRGGGEGAGGEGEEGIPMKAKIRYALQVAMAMKFLHDQDPAILHLDLKSLNILLTRKTGSDWLDSLSCSSSSSSSSLSLSSPSSSSSSSPSTSSPSLRIPPLLSSPSLNSLSLPPKPKRKKHLSLSDYLQITAKISDFGESRHLSLGSTTHASKTNGGNCCWTPPEILTSNLASKKSDVYSFGMILWELITGELPFGDVGFMFDVEKRIIKGIRPVIPEGTPVGLERLIKGCWEGGEGERPGFGVVVKQLEELCVELYGESVL